MALRLSFKDGPLLYCHGIDIVFLPRNQCVFSSNDLLRTVHFTLSYLMHFFGNVFLSFHSPHIAAPHGFIAGKLVERCWGGTHSQQSVGV